MKEGEEVVLSEATLLFLLLLFLKKGEKFREFGKFCIQFYSQRLHRGVRAPTH